MKVFDDTALEGKVAFIAGGTSGINLGIAETMAKRGAKVAVLSRSPEKVDAAIERLTGYSQMIAGFAADVRDYDAIADALHQTCERFGEIDCIVSGAAGNFLAPIVGLSSKGFRTVIDIDLIGTFNVFRAGWEHVKKGAGGQPGGSMIAISAGQAVHPKPMQAHACAAKAGINMLVKCLALEWGPAGVRVNAISPGPIANTEGMNRLTPTAGLEAELKQSLALRDYGSIQDVADMATFLASDAATYVTGSIFNVDGGNDLGDASADCLAPMQR